jgi:exodeoxyribonuclease-3
VRIATWNVNSLRARLPKVEEWLAYARPDVLCMQETKVGDDQFPSMAFSSLGYESVHHGQGQWNGVAILSRVGIDDVVDGFADGGEHDGEARLLTATCAGIRVATMYVPNGREVGHEQFVRKLGWLSRVRGHLDAVTSPTSDVVLCGDFNIAPDDRDVWDPERCHGGTHVSPEERAALRAIEDWGLHDTLRTKHEDDELYSWWDYQAGAFHKHWGMRIDLLLASASLNARLEWVLIDRNARKGQKPSDHAPLIAQFASN